ncbi:hypothetical protein G6F62_015476 [Rhizopus arrhizus]|nr:hypothetical protein G6F62_015476 [Rhizopus arrhizus]
MAAHRILHLQQLDMRTIGCGIQIPAIGQIGHPRPRNVQAVLELAFTHLGALHRQATHHLACPGVVDRPATSHRCSMGKHGEMEVPDR